MTEDRFEQQLRAYDQWKSALAQAVRDYLDWLDRHVPGSGETELRLFDALESLMADRLTVAVAAELSRGKTELLNAIFFADHGRRLLPSEPGRTTMCPTELFYDAEAKQAYVRLLPIETRLDEQSLADLRREAAYWTTIPLDTQSPEQMADAFREVTRVKSVAVQTAKRLGLYSEALHGALPDDAHLDVPVWRHALISYPHPLLQQGLTVLDTPGLNALGNEPELTLSMLPSAHALIFLVAADTGVTRSDLDLWRHHVRGTQRERADGLVVVLNKIDTLWDELREPDAVAASIDRQRAASAMALGVPEANVFPASAQKALLGKIRGDKELVTKSRLAAVEGFLTDEVLPARARLLHERVLDQALPTLGQAAQAARARLEMVHAQAGELRGLSGKNADAVMRLMRRAREEEAVHLKRVESFQEGRKQLMEKGTALLDVLDPAAFNCVAAEVRTEMSESWTTGGMKSSMKALFDSARSTMLEAQVHAAEVGDLVESLYRRFQEEHGTPDLAPARLSLSPYTQELERLYLEAEAFRKSPVTTMMEQSSLVRRFFASLATQARGVLLKAHRDTHTWLKEALRPLAAHITEHKQLLEQRIANLRNVHQSRNVLEAKVRGLQKEAESLESQIQVLERIDNQLRAPPPVEATQQTSRVVLAAV
jgi:hypothetical protein